MKGETAGEKLLGGITELKESWNRLVVFALLLWG
jgi:hypothetical protein